MFSGNSKIPSWEQQNFDLGTAQAVPWEQQHAFRGNSKRCSLGAVKAMPGNGFLSVTYGYSKKKFTAQKNSVPSYERSVRFFKKKAFAAQKKSVSRSTRSVRCFKKKRSPLKKKAFADSEKTVFGDGEHRSRGPVKSVTR